MNTREEVQKYTNLCHRYQKTNRTIRIVIIIVCVVSFLGGIAELIYSAVKNDFSKLYLFGIFSLIIPIVLFIGYLIWLATSGSKRHDQFIARLYDSNLSAEEVLQIGNTVGMNLFSLALEIRCIKELKLSGVPEWCARDGVLPDKNQITE